MRDQKAMTIRLSQEQAEILETVASVDNRPVSEVIRSAITEHVALRQQSPDFQKGLLDQIERAQRLLDQSRGSGAGDSVEP
jgi:predicted transcriptional regulator